MSEIITIEKVEEAKSTRGVYKTVTFGNNRKASCFVPGLLPVLTVGATLEVEIDEIKKDDKTYHNITAAKPGDKPAEKLTEKPASAPARGREPGERSSIERQTALKAAVELAGYFIGKGKDFGSREVLKVAGEFAAFLASGTVPKASEPKISGHDWEWLCREALKIPGMTVMKAMAILEIEKAEQWPGTWDEALAKIRAGGREGR